MRFGFGPGGVTFPAATVTPGPLSRYAGDNLPGQVGKPLDLAVGHLLSHVEQEPTVGFFNPAHQPAELAQQTRLFP